MRACAGAGLSLALALACASSTPPALDTRDLEVQRLMDEAEAALERGDTLEARDRMEDAARTGHPEAINALALFVSEGIGGLSDPERADELMEQAIAAGSVAARLNVGLALVGSPDPAAARRALALLRPLHEDPPDDEGRDFVRRRAAGGLGMAYLLGAGVERDAERGVALLEEADEEGEALPDVVFMLARSHEVGAGSRAPDASRALAYFRRGAEQGHPASQWRWGMALLEGAGVEPDPQTAHVWVRRSAEAGYTQGEISTAVMLATGEGVEEDDARAREWYQRAVEKNSAHALRGLGLMLVTGEGGPTDLARGLAYVRLAAEAGDEIAQQNLPLFEPDVAPGQQAEARTIQAEWLRERGAPFGD